MNGYCEKSENGYQLLDHVSLESEIEFSSQSSISTPCEVWGSSSAETDKNCGYLLYKLLNFYCKRKADRFAGGR